MKPLLALLLFVCPLVAQQWYTEGAVPNRLTSIDSVPNAFIDTIPKVSATPQSKLYSISVAALIGANAADLASSWGRPELNPLLTPGSSGGRFGWQAATIKLGLAGGSLLFQRYVLRRRPELQRGFAISNFIAAGAMSAVAVRNQTLGAPRIR
ncbi:MAG: hypothetical protein C0506_16080 [Anaerolinea sp.]|nr:hypothetical protein [Anaerolinea sp.]